MGSLLKQETEEVLSKSIVPDMTSCIVEGSSGGTKLPAVAPRALPAISCLVSPNRIIRKKLAVRVGSDLPLLLSTVSVRIMRLTR